MLKNYTSNDPRVFEKIQKSLITHKALKVMFTYDGTGKVAALMFSMNIENKEVFFKLPAKVENVIQIFKRDRLPLNDKGLEQAYRTAWANIKDWLEAQMALIDTDQVQFEEVFLPYAVNKDGRTYFETIKDNQYLLEGPVNR